VDPFDDRPEEAPRPGLSAADAADVHRFVARRVANFADAADIAQQTLLLACSKIHTCEGPNLSPWLFAIARNLIVDYYRARGRVSFVEVAAVAETEPALRTRPGAALTTYENRQRLSGWLRRVTRLHPEQQVALVLAEVYGHQDKESAALLRMSVPSFKLLLHGARARLAEIAGAGGPSVGGATVADRDDHARLEDEERRPCRLGVTCRLSAPALLSLLAHLLDQMTFCVSWILPGS
jgi:RNA polymerase sigma factor (sigma-70 family)